jgi:translation initiation factor SUI1
MLVYLIIFSKMNIFFFPEKEKMNTNEYLSSQLDKKLFGEEPEKKKRPISEIHIRGQQRCAGKRDKNKMLTIVEGLASDLNLKKILQALKQQFQTNGTIKTIPLSETESVKIIQLNGDLRQAIKQFFIDYKIWEEPDAPIIVHGF